MNEKQVRRYSLRSALLGLSLLVAVIVATSSQATASTRNRKLSDSSPLGSLPYKNILDASRWSKLITGRALTRSLKKSAHAGVIQDDGDPSALFAIEHGGGGNWWSCFKECAGIGPAGGICLGSCIGCMDGGAVSCGICAVCAGISIPVAEVCAIGCCIYGPGGC